ncbi:MAG TPA: MFS transporter [Gemmatimonadales bacterium]|jgi:MFS family permease|nr:MFS transporter [Gemmatimonadales bacterium]
MADPPREALPPQVKGLSAVSLFNDFASEMVYPVLPAFITGPLGGSALALGALDGAAELTAAVVKWGSGRLADRPGWAKPLILLGYAIAVLVRPLIAVVGAAWQVIGFRVIDRVGKGMRSPARDAVIADLTSPAIRGRAFGFHRAADHLGAVLGSLTAWWLLQRHASVRSVIGWSALPGVVAVLVLVVVLRGVRSSRAKNNRPTDDTDSSRPSVKSVGGSRDVTGSAFWTPVVVLVLLTASRLPETLLLLRLQDLGVPVATIPLAWAALHVVRSAGSYPGGWLTDRIGARATLGMGTLLYAGAIAALSTGIGTVGALAVFLVHGLVAGLTEPAERVAVARLAPVRTGTGFGNYQGMAGVAALPAGLAFGGIYTAMGGAAALMVSASALALLMPVWLMVARRMTRA